VITWSLNVFYDVLFGLIVVAGTLRMMNRLSIFSSRMVKVVRHDQLVGKVGPVEVSVVTAADDDLAVVVKGFGDLNGHMVTHHLFGHPTANGVGAPELPASVVDEGIGREGGDDGILVEGIDRR
jgi:hypothetical protein